MSESKEHFNRDFSKFDEMSTEELNEILRQDSQLPDGEDSDTDAILYIMGVIAKRNQELPSSDFGDVNHAWSSFNKNYRFASSEGCSLFDFDDEPQLNGTSDKTQILRGPTAFKYASTQMGSSHSPHPRGSHCRSAGNLSNCLCIWV